MKHYHIEITGVGPASNGKSDTDADLLLQALLATLKSVGHKVSKAVITVDGRRMVLVSEKGSAPPPPAQGDPNLKEIHANVLRVIHLLTADKQPDSAPVLTLPKPSRKKKGGGEEKEPHQPGNASNPDEMPEGTTGQPPPQSAPESTTGDAPQIEGTSSASAPTSEEA